MFGRKKEIAAIQLAVETLSGRVSVLEQLLENAAEMMRQEERLMAERDNLYSYTGREQPKGGETNV